MRKYSEKKIQADKTGSGYIFQMFYNELQKHKRPVGMVETNEVLTALGYDLEDLQHNKALQSGLNMAVSAVNDEVYEDNRPQPVDYYHFTDKEGKAINGFTLEWYITQAIKDALTDIQFKIDFHDAVTSYLLCEWGTLNREADEDNGRALKDPKNASIAARYHTCNGDIYISTEGNSKTLVYFTYELVEKYANQLTSLETVKNSKHTGNYSVYMHVSPERKLYIGMTQNIENRYGHNGNGYRPQPAFRDAIKKYGWNNIDHKAIASDLSKEEAEKLEHEAIVLLQTQENGYNRNDGGSGKEKKPIKCLTDGKIYNSLEEATEQYHLSNGFVCKVCKGVAKSAKGLQFEYIEEN